MGQAGSYAAVNDAAKATVKVAGGSYAANVAYAVNEAAKATVKVADGSYAANVASKVAEGVGQAARKVTYLLGSLFGFCETNENVTVDNLGNEMKSPPRPPEDTEKYGDFDTTMGDGVQPTIHLTRDQFEAKKREYRYQKSFFHIAVVGFAGAGKSSLVNALLGLRNHDPGAAPVGTVETTFKTARYLHQKYPTIVLYDNPGAGTPNIPAWKYFLATGLYIFDCIIVVVNDCFTEVDKWVLQSCELMHIPTYIVRSKSDQHISNMIASLQDDDDDEELDSVTRAQLREQLKLRYITESQINIRRNLRDARLDDDQKLYLVSRDTVRSIMHKGKPAKTALVIDEWQLIQDILEDGAKRRGGSDTLNEIVIRE
jgi:GTP-binding protein EngB required for normal cell division